MLDDFVISGLAGRRASLAGEIIHIEKQLKQKLLDLKTLDAAIKLFDADYPIEAIKPKAVQADNAWTRGEMTRLIFEILRQSSVPMSARDIGLEVMSRKKMDTTRRGAIASMRKRIGEALKHQRDNGQVRCQKEPGQPLMWETVMRQPVASTPSTAC